ncbi:pyridoxamine 5'-phosphate oxidase [Rhodococcus sp. NPDC058505]|uniref:pyridoxamine 5'-phosphate oxidase n=1 Tax=unclassified Rhodococcus (in: high G+C Gram-positive bacteria) TaxID=192944 RepID=UPI003656BB69
MPTMSSAEREAFLADIHVGVVAVERPDRAPLAVPVWYGYEPGGEVLIWTETDTIKEPLFRAAGRFTLTAQLEQVPYKYVSAEGPITSIAPITADQATAIAVRYLGEEEGTAYAAQNLTPRSILVRMRPQRWLSTDYSKL